MTQKQAFLDGEGDAYFKRNGPRGGEWRDPLMLAISDLPVRRAIEIGCSSGERLAELRRVYGVECTGLDPSEKAINSGRLKHKGINLIVGTADDLGYVPGPYDLVIFGFCLYLCDRGDLFKIACESDRVLEPGGYIAIYDFHTRVSYSRPYEHLRGAQSFKMDCPSMFLWHPSYRMVRQEVFGVDGMPDPPDDEAMAVTILRKAAA